MKVFKLKGLAFPSCSFPTLSLRVSQPRFVTKVVAIQFPFRHSSMFTATTLESSVWVFWKLKRWKFEILAGAGDASLFQYHIVILTPFFEIQQLMHCFEIKKYKSEKKKRIGETKFVLMFQYQIVILTPFFSI